MNEDDSLVTILIKAPNQRINDQTVQCCPNWTIKELKHHLASVYPNKPHPDGQKLIYSGCLLPDGAILSEVLRTYDGQQNNTIHLVCAPSKESSHQPQTKIMNQEKSKVNISTVPPPVPQSFEDNTPLHSSHNNEELRRRVPYVPFTSSWPPNYDEYGQQQMYQQMLWMQQAYMHYMAQCFQFAYNGTNLNTVSEREQDTQQENTAAQPNQGPEDEGEEDGHFHRDWLDWVYLVSRLAVLVSVVYFYSSPVRCIMVITMALLLYHLGMLRWRPGQNNNNNNDNINNNRVDVVEEEHDVNNENQQEPQAVQEVQYPNWLVVFWTFLSSFFLSLIPEPREV